MTVDFSVLNNRAVTGVGQIFASGHYVKTPFLIPSNGFLSANLKALIYQEQGVVFSEIESLDGITFEKNLGSVNYFEEDNIHESVNFDPNKRAIWIDLKDQQNQGTDKPRIIIPTIIYVSAGKGSAEVQPKRNSGYLRGILNLLLVTPNEFLVVGFPSSISSSQLVYKKSLQPEVKIQFKADSNPDIGNLEGNASRPIGELKFDIELTPKHNIIT